MKGTFPKNSGPVDPWKLIEETKQGDEKAFGILYQEYFAPVYRYIYLRTRDKEEAEDLTQVTFLKVFENVGSITKNRDAPLNYFFTVARNTVIDYTKKKKAILVEEEVWHTIPDTKDIGKDLELTEFREKVLNSIQHLDETDREMLQLRLIEELSNKEIAELLGKSEVSVRKAYSRALAKLREKLQEHGF